LKSTEIFELHPFEECTSSLHQVLRCRVRAKEKEIRLGITLDSLIARLIVRLKCEVHCLPHVGPTGEGAEDLVVVVPGEFLHPMLLRKALEVSFVGEKKEGIEVDVFGNRLSIAARVHAHLTLAVLVYGDEV
jgi:hypothetical protein